MTVKGCSLDIWELIDELWILLLHRFQLPATRINHYTLSYRSPTPSTFAWSSSRRRWSSWTRWSTPYTPGTPRSSWPACLSTSGWCNCTRPWCPCCRSRWGRPMRLAGWPRGPPFRSTSLDWGSLTLSTWGSSSSRIRSSSLTRLV